MGIDKSLIEVNGVSLVGIVGRSLIGAGVAEVVTIGGDRNRLVGIEGIDRALEDEFPNEGPLGGIITALRHASTDLVVVLACDTPAITSSTPQRLIETMEANDGTAVVFAEVAGRVQPLTAIWRRSRSLTELERIFEAGERAPRVAFEVLTSLRVTDIDPTGVDDVDFPSDLRRYAAPSTIDRE